MKRTIEVSTRGTQLSLANSRLVIQREGIILGNIPIEDIGVLVLDSTGIELSSGALRAFADAGCALLSCDDRHHPNGMFLPLVANTLHAERLRFQVFANDPLKRNLWSKIIASKIRNQSALLACTGTRKRLTRLAQDIKSGDKGNSEAQAGRFYWPMVFDGMIEDSPGPFLRRRAGAPPNDLLNYGYAVLRAATARAICASGLHPGLGIHHQNRYSGYCLADDLMEPFRPWVDKRVQDLLKDGIGELNKEGKKAVLEVLTDECTVSDALGPVLSALDRSASSLARCFEASAKGDPTSKSVKHLLLPKWPRLSCVRDD